MSQYQPTPNTLYRIQSLAFGSYLSLTDVDEGEMPRLIGLQDAQKQYWQFIADPSAKNTYKIVNAAPNPEDIDTHYALNVVSPNAIVAKDADTKTSVWRIAISADRDHCTFTTSYPGQPDSKPHLQANASGPVGLALDSHRNSQNWRLIEVGSSDSNASPTNAGPSKTPQRMPEIPNGLYRVRNILVRRIAFIGPQGYPCATFDTDKTPFEIRYENSSSPYFSMKVSGTKNYLGEINGIMNCFDPSPFLWYLDKTPEFKESYFICPKTSGAKRSWSGKMSEVAGIGDVFNTVPEIMKGKLDGHQDLDANCWQRWWIRPA